MSNLKCVIRIRVRDIECEEGSDFGHGIAMLLEGVKECGSLNRAAKEMGMAYSKAWKSIKNTEAALGFELLERRAQHGSVLTDMGEEFLIVYKNAEEAGRKAAQKVFDGFWEDVKN